MDNELRSLIFKYWNKARACGKFEQGRLNRALGLCLSNAPRKYGETIRDCACQDHYVRGIYCKHMIRMMIMHRVYEELQLVWLGEHTIETKRKEKVHAK